MKYNWLRILFAGCCIVGILGMTSPTLADDTAPAGHAYVGSKACKTCHMGEKNGKIWESWLESAHAKALARLDPAKGEDKDPKCLKCHTTGFGTATGFKVDAADNSPEGLASVGCESCHGPGADYKSMKVMKDRPAALAAGLVVPNEETCKACHNAESPTFKGFDFAEMYKKIEHHVPAKAEGTAE